MTNTDWITFSAIIQACSAIISAIATVVLVKVTYDYVKRTEELVSIGRKEVAMQETETMEKFAPRLMFERSNFSSTSGMTAYYRIVNIGEHPARDS